MSCKLNRAHKIDGLPSTYLAEILVVHNMESVSDEAVQSYVDLKVSKLLSIDKSANLLDFKHSHEQNTSDSAQYYGTNRIGEQPWMAKRST